MPQLQSSRTQLNRPFSIVLAVEAGLSTCQAGIQRQPGSMRQDLMVVVSVVMKIAMPVTCVRPSARVCVCVVFLCLFVCVCVFVCLFCLLGWLFV